VAANSPLQRKFGESSHLDPPGPISATSQSLILLASQSAQIIASLVAGSTVERTGYRRLFIGALCLAAGFLFVAFFALNLGMIIAAEFLLGIPWGVFASLTSIFVSDLAPRKLKPYLTTYVNMCWVFGQLLASGVIKASMTIADDTWAYRVPIAVQWLWQPILITAVLLGPESPLWLVRHGKKDQANQTIRRLVADPKFDARGPVALMMEDNEKEKTYAESTSYRDLITGANRRRTEVVLMCQLTQQWCGSHLIFYSAKLYQMGGMPENMSFNFNLIQYSLAICGVLTSWVLMKNFGRRTIWISALSAMFVLLVAVGTLGFFVEKSATVPWAIGSLLLVFALVYNMSIGPLCYTITPEVPTTRLKARSGVVGRTVYNLAGIFNLFIGPKMLESKETGDAWGWGPKTAFFWAGMCIFLLLWAIFRLPETKNRGPGELNVLFSKGVPARKFATMDVDEFSETVASRTRSAVVA
jgi:MFS transporter, SP family, general alpha glucoside:H+ symporter